MTRHNTSLAWPLYSTIDACQVTHPGFQPSLGPGTEFTPFLWRALPSLASWRAIYKPGSEFGLISVRLRPSSRAWPLCVRVLCQLVRNRSAASGGFDVRPYRTTARHVLCLLRVLSGIEAHGGGEVKKKLTVAFFQTCWYSAGHRRSIPWLNQQSELQCASKWRKQRRPRRPRKSRAYPSLCGSETRWPLR